MLKYALLLPIIYFVYLTVFNIPFLPSFGLQNWIIITILIIIEIPVIIFERRLKKAQFEANINLQDTNPFTTPQKDSSKEDSFVSYLKSGAESLVVKSDGAMNAFRRSGFHYKVFFKIKRVLYGIMFIFYVGLALTSLNNPIFLVLFVITAYAFLENLLWTRHYQWTRRKKKEDES